MSSQIFAWESCPMLWICVYKYSFMQSLCLQEMYLLKNMKLLRPGIALHYLITFCHMNIQSWREFKNPATISPPYPYPKMCHIK